MLQDSDEAKEGKAETCGSIPLMATLTDFEPYLNTSMLKLEEGSIKMLEIEESLAPFVVYVLPSPTYCKCFWREWGEQAWSTLGSKYGGSKNDRSFGWALSAIHLLNKRKGVAVSSLAMDMKLWILSTLTTRHVDCKIDSIQVA